MRNVILLNNVDASIQQISNGVNLERRTDWELIIESNGLDGTPNLFIEKGYNAGKCNDLPTEWFIEPNVCKVSNEFSVDDSLIQIVKNGFTANWFRVRVEANDNTTGTISVTIHYKTYP